MVISHQSWWPDLAGEKGSNGSGSDGAVTTLVGMLEKERYKSTKTNDDSISGDGGGRWVWENIMSGPQEPSQGSGEVNSDPQHVDSNVFHKMARQMSELLNILRAHAAA
ncbi:hypothetical protein Scep_004555 [Stephania cephalantha]|uniref:Uncharacterized protein n=1 Tax=Stephania cephalantha TaxID=152367 RepID=A0AAP0KSY5_9MAGN